MQVSGSNTFKSSFLQPTIAGLPNRARQYATLGFPVPDADLTYYDCENFPNGQDVVREGDDSHNNGEDGVYATVLSPHNWSIGLLPAQGLRLSTNVDSRKRRRLYRSRPKRSHHTRRLVSTRILTKLLPSQPLACKRVTTAVSCTSKPASSKQFRCTSCHNPSTCKARRQCKY